MDLLKKLKKFIKKKEVKFPAFDPKSMVADRYRAEQDFIRGRACEKCHEEGLDYFWVEAYVGIGNLSKLYNRYFDESITNDINENSIADYNLDATEFVTDIVSTIVPKIDLIDFDAYRCPVPDVKAFFNIPDMTRHAPFALCISDGLGLWMKRSSKVEKIHERFLTEDFEGFDERHPWRQHKEFWMHLLTKLCKEKGLKVEEIEVMQTKGLNYVLGAYWISK